MRVQTGDVEQILFLVYDNTGQPVTGRTTIRVRILRTSDNWLYDFSDNTFKAAGHTTLDAAMVEIDATNAAGIYELVGGFDTAAITNPTVDDTYVIIPSQTTGDDILPSPTSFTVGQWADDIATMPVDVDTQLSSTHGAGLWAEESTGTPFDPDGVLP